MLRFSGQRLPDGCSIAVVANDAIGNFVVTTPLMQMLRAHYKPSRLSYFGGLRTWEMQSASDLSDDTHILHGGSPVEVAAQIKQSTGQYDLVFNCESTALSKAFSGLVAGDRGYVAGPSMGLGGRGDLPFQDDLKGDLWRDKEWIAHDLTARYPFLQSGFIGEIFCRLAYMDGPVPSYKVPTEDPPIAIPDVLIAMSASLPEKLWPLGHWQAIASELAQNGVTIGLLGAKPSSQKQHWKGTDEESELVRGAAVQDLRGVLTLPEVVGALTRARAVFTLDNGILHLAVAAGTPTVGLFRYGIHRLWAPPSDNLTVLTPGPGNAVAEISVEAAVEALQSVL